MKDLKLLVKDYAPIAKNALTMLINISADDEVLKDIAKDDAFLEMLLSRITVCQFSRGIQFGKDGWLIEAAEQEGAPRE